MLFFFPEIMTIQMLGEIIALPSFILFAIDLFDCLVTTAQMGSTGYERPSGRYYFTELCRATSLHTETVSHMPKHDAQLTHKSMGLKGQTQDRPWQQHWWELLP